MTIVVRFDATTQIVRRADVDVVVAQLEKIDIPHGASLPALLGSFGRHPSPVNIGGLPPEAPTGRRVAERKGFEPLIRVSPYNGLANRRLQPLGHLSGAAGMPEHHILDKARSGAAERIATQPRKARAAGLEGPRARTKRNGAAARNAPPRSRAR